MCKEGLSEGGGLFRLTKESTLMEAAQSQNGSE